MKEKIALSETPEIYTDLAKSQQISKEIASLSPDGVRVYPTVVVRETYLEDMFKNGEYKPCTPEEAADLGGKIIEIFEKAKIPIIRFGLNPTDDLSGGDAVSGAYHPALGEMAMAAYFLALCEKEIAKEEISGDCIEITVNSKRISVMTGQKKRNKSILSEKFGFKEIKILGNDEIPDGKVMVRIYKKA